MPSLQAVILALAASVFTATRPALAVNARLPASTEEAMFCRSASGISTIFVAVSLASTAAANAAWSCSGQWEVTCAEAACSVAEEGGFTPVGVSIDADGEMQFCAYSGCWIGPVTSTQVAGRYETIVGIALAWSHEGGSSEDVLVSIDNKTGFGVVLSAGFVSPLKCEQTAEESSDQ
jgi:hypothetical protein